MVFDVGEGYQKEIPISPDAMKAYQELHRENPGFITANKSNNNIEKLTIEFNGKASRDDYSILAF
ncbi:hypothetical protein EI200_24390 [Peribacillus simplex]|uniref:hypothetical protein n=1 Tax=Peribacillus simplex TaxID=1478 RepID=UPI000F62D124|nr:hypothetical protein [Peribacillus simplex]RRN66890.1 hypothetical protein EI200_24390 [Peribacillus simplex]